MAIAKSAVVSVKKIIHNDKWIIAELVDVKFDNGKEIKNFLRLTAKNGGYTMVVPRLADGRFILTRQYKPVAGLTIEGVAGGRESDETWDETSLREMAEEVGYRPGKLVRVGIKFFPLSDRVNNPCHLYLAFNCILGDGQAKQDEVQGVEAVIFTKTEVMDLIKNGKIKDLATVAGIFAHLAFESGNLKKL